MFRSQVHPRHHTSLDHSEKATLPNYANSLVGGFRRRAGGVAPLWHLFFEHGGLGGVVPVPARYGIVDHYPIIL